MEHTAVLHPVDGVEDLDVLTSVEELVIIAQAPFLLVKRSACTRLIQGVLYRSAQVIAIAHLGKDVTLVRTTSVTVERLVI